MIESYVGLRSLIPLRLGHWLRIGYEPATCFSQLNSRNFIYFVFSPIQRMHRRAAEGWCSYGSRECPCSPLVTDSPSQNCGNLTAGALHKGERDSSPLHRSRRAGARESKDAAV